jgi:hypothetical protein
MLVTEVRIPRRTARSARRTPGMTLPGDPGSCRLWPALPAPRWDGRAWVPGQGDYLDTNRGFSFKFSYLPVLGCVSRETHAGWRPGAPGTARADARIASPGRKSILPRPVLRAPDACHSAYLTICTFALE